MFFNILQMIRTLNNQVKAIVQKHIFSFSGQPGGLSYPGRVAGDPGVDARQVLPGASHAPADHPGQTPGPLLHLTHQGASGVSLTRVLNKERSRRLALYSVTDCNHVIWTRLKRIAHLILPAGAEHGVSLPVPGVSREHLAANILVENLDLNLSQHVGHPTPLLLNLITKY